MASPQIPEDFLNAPQGASLRQPNFLHTTPPIPAYEDYFAAIIDNFMTEEECNQLLHLVKSSHPSWDRAMVNTGNGTQIMSVDTRNCGRIIWNTPDIAQRLLGRLTPFLRECGLCDVENRPLITGIGPAK
jgi:hypothetical protein